jgi:hypothetical protein
VTNILAYSDTESFAEVKKSFTVQASVENLPKPAGRGDSARSIFFIYLNVAIIDVQLSSQQILRLLLLKCYHGETFVVEKSLKIEGNGKTRNDQSNFHRRIVHQVIEYFNSIKKGKINVHYHR